MRISITHKVLFSGLCLAFTLIIGGFGGGAALAVPPSASYVPTVTGPTLSANGLLMYEVNFPKGQDYGAVLASVNKDGTVTAQFFDNKKEYEAARGPSGLDNPAAQVNSNRGEVATAQVIAPNMDASSTTGERGTATVHQRRVEATALIEDVVYIDMNRAQSKETYTYNGTNVTAASGWGSSWWNTGTGWYNLYGPVLNIGSVPASNVLLTNDCGYTNQYWPGGPYTNLIQVRTRGYGSGYGVAGFSFAIDPKGPAWGWHWGGEYSVVNIY